MKRKFGEPQMFVEAREAKKGLNWFLELLLFGAVFVVGAVAEGLVPGIMSFVQEASSGISSLESIMGAATNSTIMSEPVMLAMLFCTAFMIIIVLLYCGIFQKRKPATLGFRKKGFLKEYLLGILIGVIMIAVAILLAVVTGSATLTLSNNMSIMIVVFFVAYLIQGMSEEVLCRGFFMVSFSRKHPVWLAILLDSILFSLLHVANPGFGIMPFINITLFGIAMSLIFYKRGNIWIAGAIHSIWNFCQGNIFGCSVSGNGDTVSIFRYTANSGSDLLSGGSFGVEGGILTTALLVVAILVIYFWIPKKKDEFLCD